MSTGARSARAAHRGHRQADRGTPRTARHADPLPEDVCAGVAARAGTRVSDARRFGEGERMKSGWASIAAAFAASICCLGPVIAVTVGATTLTAVAIRFEPFRPVFLMLTAALLGFAFLWRLPSC